MSARDLWSRLPQPPDAVPDDAAFSEEVVALYAAPPRHYHTFDHVVEVARWFDRVRRDVGWRREAEVFVAVLFHDAVYEAGAPDNERRSADAARDAIGRWSMAVDADRVAELIDLTARHGQIDAATVDGDAALFLDCDMAILGAEPGAFADYERAIEREYGHLDPAAYRAGRRHFLERVLASEHLYVSDYFRDRLEAKARANIRASLQRLTSKH